MNVNEKKFLQKTMLCIFTTFMLLTLCLLSIIRSEITAYADEAIDNPTYTLTSTNGDRVSTKANPDETTVLIFGYIGCSKTRSTLNSISSCNWVKRSDIRVIFAETNGHTQEEVLAYEEGYNCQDMIFCYDESETIFMVMAAYGKLFGMNGGSYPMIVLIDKNNKIQNLLTGTKTSDEILDEIKKFEDIDESGTNTPPSDSDSGIENIAYGLKSIENTTVSTKANPNETTVLIFGYTTCGNTKATLRDIDQSDWVSRSDIRVIFADVYGASLSETKEFAEDYISGDIIFCHDESMLNYNLALTYLSLYNLTGGTYPYIILIDQNNKIQGLTLGPKTADEIIAEIEKFTKEDQTTGGNTGDNTGGNTGDNTGSNTGGNTGDNTGSNTGGNTGDNTGSNTGGNTGDNTGNNTGGSTGDNTGSNTGNNTGNNTGSNTGSNTGNNTGNNIGGNTGSVIIGNTNTTDNTVTPDNINKPDNTNTSDDINKPDNTNTSDDINEPDNTNTSDDINEPDNTNTSDDINKPDNTNTSDDIDTTNNDNINESEDNTDTDTSTTTTKKKAKINTVKAAKGKKLVSGTVKLSSGKVVKNATIKIYVNNKKKTTVKTDSNGKFSTKLSKKLVKGDKVKLVITKTTIKKITKTITIK